MVGKFNTTLPGHHDLNDLVEIVKSEIPGKKIVFFVGAGVSIEPPSYIPGFPQKRCLEVMRGLNQNEKDVIADKIRPEVFFQVLYNHLGKQALAPFQVLNPEYINREGPLTYPNDIHEFLADMLNNGHIVLTTNFDNLIEEAYRTKFGTRFTAITIYDKDFEKLNKEITDDRDRFDATGHLLKIHGSFAGPEGNDTSDSIIALLEHVQKEFPQYERTLINFLLEHYDWIVLGQSGRDDFDLFTVLADPGNKGQRGKIFWIKHHRELLDPDSFDVEVNSSMGKKLQDISKNPHDEKKWDTQALQNIYSILTSFPEGSGWLIHAHTGAFIKNIRKDKAKGAALDNNSRIEKKITAHLTNWAKTVNIYKREYIFSDLYKLMGNEYLDYSIALYHHGAKKHEEFLHGKVTLMEADVLYRKRIDMHIAFRKAHRSFETFEELGDLEGIAEARYIMSLIYNRDYGEISKGIDTAIETVGNNLVLAAVDPGFRTNLARSLRLVALLSINKIPDIADLEDGPLKDSFGRILDGCIRLCEQSELLFNKIGNVTGEGGINQTLNVHGLILLRKGDYGAAVYKFQEFLRLSDSSRLLRESFQGYRNLGLCLYNQGLSAKGENKNDLMMKSIQALKYGMICLGIDINDAHLNLFDSGDSFVGSYNLASSLIESDNSIDKSLGKRFLTSLSNETELRKMFPTAWWHGKAISLQNSLKYTST